jgi:hypothetical protein
MLYISPVACCFQERNPIADLREDMFIKILRQSPGMFALQHQQYLSCCFRLFSLFYFIHWFVEDFHKMVHSNLDDNKELNFAHIQTVCARQFGVPRSDTWIHLTEKTTCDLHHAPRRSKPSSTTSTSDKGATNSQPSSATPLKNMVNSLGRFSTEPASSGTSLRQSLPLHRRPKTLPRLSPQ